MLPGGYLEANTSYQVNAQWSVTAFGRYDVSDALKGNVGAANLSVKVSGWTVGVGATYRF